MMQIYSIPYYTISSGIFHPYLVYKYNQNTGLDDDTHECDIMNNSECKRLWEKSIICRDSKNARYNNYDELQHKVWCNESNCGVNHLEFHPELLQLSTIRFDMFYCSCAVIRKL